MRFFLRTEHNLATFLTIYNLVEEKGLNIADLTEDIKNKMAAKGDPFEKRKGLFEKKEKSLELRWKKDLEQQVTELPEFEKVFREVKREFRQAGLLEK